MKSIRNFICILFVMISLVLSLQSFLFAQVEKVEIGIVGMVCNL
jgi:hypothetical protein